MKKLQQITYVLLMIALPLGTIIAQNGKTKHVKKSKHKKEATKKETDLKPGPEIKWFQGKEPDFENEAYKKGKPGIVYVYVEDVPECDAFNNKVLRDSDVVKFVDSNFVAYRVNLEYDWPGAMKFDIDGTPSVVLLDKHCKPIDIMQGMREKEDFMKFLKQAVKKK